MILLKDINIPEDPTNRELEEAANTAIENAKELQREAGRYRRIAEHLRKRIRPGNE